MKSLMNIAESMTSLYESLFDIDDNIDNLDPEVMYGLWNAKTGDEYEKIGERIEKLVENSCKVASYLKKPFTFSDLKPNKYYFGFNWTIGGGPIFAFNVYFKKGDKYCCLEIGWLNSKNKMRISLEDLHPNTEIWLNPKETYEANDALTWIIEKLIKIAKK